MEADKHNSLENGEIAINAYIGYVRLNNEYVIISDLMLTFEELENFTFSLEINYNNEERIALLKDFPYLSEEYAVSIHHDNVIYSKYHSLILDADKMKAKSFGFINVEIYLNSNFGEKHLVSSETLNYGVTDTEIVFGLYQNPIIEGEGPGVIIKDWGYKS